MPQTRLPPANSLWGLKFNVRGTQQCARLFRLEVEWRERSEFFPAGPAFLRVFIFILRVMETFEKFWYRRWNGPVWNLEGLSVTEEKPGL